MANDEDDTAQERKKEEERHGLSNEQVAIYVKCRHTQGNIYRKKKNHVDMLNEQTDYDTGRI